MKRAEMFLFEKGCPEVNIGVLWDNEALLAFYDGLTYAQGDVVILGKRLILDD